MVNSQKAIYILDQMPLRRASLVCFLAPWAAANQCSITMLSLAQAHARLLDAGNCDLIIYNAGGPSGNGELFAEVRVLRMISPASPLIVLSDDESLDCIVALKNAGVHACLSNSMDPDIALRAISMILGGGTYFPPAASLFFSSPATEQSSETASNDLSSPIDVADDKLKSIDLVDDIHKMGLTPQQWSVLALLSRGDANKVISRKLGWTETAVKAHVREIMRKFGVSNRTQIAIVAFKCGIVTAPDSNPGSPASELFEVFDRLRLS